MYGKIKYVLMRKMFFFFFLYLLKVKSQTINYIKILRVEARSRLDEVEF